MGAGEAQAPVPSQRDSALARLASASQLLALQITLAPQ
jgi:hypothetical protein